MFFTQKLADSFLWVSTTHLKSPGFFLGFWLISSMLQFGWSLLVLISKFLSPFNSLVTVPSAPITIGIITTSIVFFNSLVRFMYLSLFSFFFIFPGAQAKYQRPLFDRLSILLIITRFDRLAEIRSSVCISKYQKLLCVSFSRIDSALCRMCSSMSNLNFFHNSLWITFPTQSCLFYTTLH